MGFLKDSCTKSFETAFGCTGSCMVLIGRGTSLFTATPESHPSALSPVCPASQSLNAFFRFPAFLYSLRDSRSCAITLSCATSHFWSGLRFLLLTAGFVKRSRFSLQTSAGRSFLQLHLRFYACSLECNL